MQLEIDLVYATALREGAVAVNTDVLISADAEAASSGKSVGPAQGGGDIYAKDAAHVKIVTHHMRTAPVDIAADACAGDDFSVADCVDAAALGKAADAA